LTSELPKRACQLLCWTQRRRREARRRNPGGCTTVGTSDGNVGLLQQRQGRCQPFARVLGPELRASALSWHGDPMWRSCVVVAPRAEDTHTWHVRCTRGANGLNRASSPWRHLAYRSSDAKRPQNESVRVDSPGSCSREQRRSIPHWGRHECNPSEGRVREPHEDLPRLFPAVSPHCRRRNGRARCGREGLRHCGKLRGGVDPPHIGTSGLPWDPECRRPLAFQLSGRRWQRSRSGSSKFITRRNGHDHDGCSGGRERGSYRSRGRQPRLLAAGPGAQPVDPRSHRRGGAAELGQWRG
jgi:hypothetical protein